MLIEFAKRGYGLDAEQMAELGSYSRKTMSAIRDVYNTPAWQQICKIKWGEPSHDMKELARQLNIPIGSNKEQICDTLEIMSTADPERLKAASYQVNLNRIKLSAISATDLLTGKILSENRTLPALGTGMTIDEIQQMTQMAASEATPAQKAKTAHAMPVGSNDVHAPAGAKRSPICSNNDTLSRPIEDYPSVDRVTYADGNKTWCFTSDNYSDLIRTGINPNAINARGGLGDTIPQEILAEMEQKLDAIRSNGLSENPGSISDGVSSLFQINPLVTENAFEQESIARVEEFYEFMEYYGVDREAFTGLTSADYQSLADAVLSPTTRIVVSPKNSILAMRDFASSVLREAYNFGSRDELGPLIAQIMGYP